MSRQKYKGKTNHAQPVPKTARKKAVLWRDRWWLAAGVLAIGIGALIILLAAKNGGKVDHARAAMKERPAEQQTNADIVPAELASPDTEWDPTWPSLPASGEPGRPIGVVRAMYAYAARRGDVLQYIPCYCGCERQGHHSNRDCFVKEQSSTGVKRWDEMGYT